MSTSVSEKIKIIIDSYKENFDSVNKGERYKWEAVAWYKKHWNIEADNFADMVATAFEKSSNLLTAGMYYAYSTLKDYASRHPEKVRSLFRVLHDESLPLSERYEAYREGFDEHIAELKSEEANKDKHLQHYQDLHAISVYLFFEYPEKYFIYKSSMYTKVRDRIGFAEEKTKKKSTVWKYEQYAAMCELILSEIHADSALRELSQSRIDDSCYKDSAYHLLSMDIAFYGGVYMSESDYTQETSAASDDGYWPSLAEYNPGLTKNDWKRYILEVEKPEHPSPMAMLKAMMELGGESTCKKLSEIYGGNPSRYAGCTVNLGKRARKYFDLPTFTVGGRDRVYVIPFLGKTIIEKGNEYYSYRIRPELLEALKEIDLSDVDPYYNQDAEEIAEDGNTVMTDISLNTILYGPPGTGKTYHTVIYAVAVIENKQLADVEKEEYEEVLARYNEYKADGRIAFTTFHQSYGYEEFIEGIKPAIVSDDEEGRNDIRYDVMPGVFKRFCEKAKSTEKVEKVADYGLNSAPNIWKVSLGGTGDNPDRTECMENNHIRIGWDEHGKDITDETDFTKIGGKAVLNSFMNRMKIGDIVLSCYSSTTIDAIGVVTGDYEWHNEYSHLKRLRKVNWIVKGIEESIMDITDGTTMTLSTVYRFSNISLDDVLKIVEKYKPVDFVSSSQKKNYVFIIDEINRGNISKIFGELITLIEPSKRLGSNEEADAVLPYSGKPFGVPNNVYIIGTMNTADRSIATLDTALRRRFYFKEMLPNPEVLRDVSVEDISIGALLERMNKRISVLYDREHTIGHAYFMSLKSSPTIDTLARIFENNIIPLLQEYFYEDYEKIRLVLGDNKKDEESQFIIAKSNDYAELFGNADVGLDDGYSYEINKKAFANIEAYRSI